VIAFSAIIATTSVFLVFQLGQPRIWMSMSRDGLLPKKFASIHPRYRTPAFSTVMTGFLVAVPLLFMNFTLVTNLTSIGTLFAFALVCGGVLVMHQKKDLPERKFKVPFISGKYIVPIAFMLGAVLMYIYNRESMMNFLTFKSGEDPTAGTWQVGWENLPYWIFIIYAILISWYAFKLNLSLIPILGLSMCIYLMSALHVTTWEGFTIWLVIGLVIYFFYGYKNSKLNKEKAIPGNNS
jgi:amino acid transporter